MEGAHHHAVIELRVDTLSQLFDTLDPYPFREKDLDRKAETYIVGWAQELPHARPFEIVIHLPKAEALGAQASQVRTAMNHYFNDRADIAGRDLKELFRSGRISLAVGACVLAVAIAATLYTPDMFGNAQVNRFVSESFVILAWVANWKPIEIFLYDWWPFLRRRNLFRRLADATVSLRPY